MPKELKLSILKHPGGVALGMITSVEKPPDKLLKDAYGYEKKNREILKAAEPFDRLDLVIDSSGGYVASAAGMAAAIEEAVKGKNRSIRILIDGQCSSAATMIAYGLPFKGIPVYITPRSHILVHLPKSGVYEKTGSDWKYLQRMAKLVTTNHLIAIYKDRTRRPRAEIRQWMKDSKTFTAGEAVMAGLADAITTLAAFQKGG